MMEFGLGGFGVIWMLLFWIGLVGLAIWLVVLLFPSVKSRPPDRRDTSPATNDIFKIKED